MSMSQDEITSQIWDRIAKEQQEQRRIAEDRSNAHTLSITAPGRPDDSTTRVLRAFIAFLTVLEQEGAKVEHQINSTEVASIFSLPTDFYRKVLNPLGMLKSGLTYNTGDRASLIASAKAIYERMLLKHETDIMHIGQPQYGQIGHVKPSGPELWANPSKGYMGGNDEQPFSGGYNTAEHNAMRGEHLRDEP